MKPSESNQPILPNFLIAGAAKCGTTSLYHYLRQHPDVFMSEPKEPKFLSGTAARGGCGPGDDLVERNIIRTWREYVSLFEKAGGKKAIGEASVDTVFYAQQSIPAICHYLGSPKILIILRDPVERAYSAYNHLVRDGREKLPFNEALAVEAGRKRKGYRHLWLYKEGGLYADRVQAFKENLDRVMVLLYDDLRRDPESMLRSIFAFLEVDPDFSPDVKHVHNVAGVPRVAAFDKLFVRPRRLHKMARKIGGVILGADRWIRLRDRIRSINLDKPRPMSTEIAHELRDFFREDVLKLQKLIGRDLGDWIDGKGRNG